MKNKLSLLFPSIFLIFLSAIAVQVSACACSSKTSCEAYYSADFVFIGKAVGTKNHKVTFKKPNGENDEIEAKDFVFEIQEVFSAAKDISEVTLLSEVTTCDFLFKIGEKYLVFAYKSDDGTYYTSACSHTNKLSEAKKDLKFLRKDLPKMKVPIC